MPARWNSPAGFALCLASALQGERMRLDRGDSGAHRRLVELGGLAQQLQLDMVASAIGELARLLPDASEQAAAVLGDELAMELHSLVPAALGGRPVILEVGGRSTRSRPGGPWQVRGVPASHVARALAEDDRIFAVLAPRSASLPPIAREALRMAGVAVVDCGAGPSLLPALLDALASRLPGIARSIQATPGVLEGPWLAELAELAVRLHRPQHRRPAGLVVHLAVDSAAPATPSLLWRLDESRRPSPTALIGRWAPREFVLIELDANSSLERDVAHLGQVRIAGRHLGVLAAGTSPLRSHDAVESAIIRARQAAALTARTTGRWNVGRWLGGRVA